MKKTNLKSPAAYCSPFPGKLSIMALMPFSDFSVNEFKVVLTELHECGFNLIKQEVPPLGIVQEKDNVTFIRPCTVDSILKHIEKSSQLTNSLKVVLSQDLIVRNTIGELYTTDISRCIEQYQNSPYVYAWEIANSPSWHQWSSDDKVGENKNNLIEEAYCLTVNADSDHPVFTTLPFPGLDIGSGGGTNQYYPDRMSYEEYFGKFDSHLPSSLLAYNPQLTKQSVTIPKYERMISCQEETYRMLKFFMQSSLKLDRDKPFHRVPFWACCTNETDTYGNNFDDSAYRKILWCAFNALAYGAQGLSFHASLCRTSVSGDKNTAEVSVRDDVRAVLSEIKKFENIFASCSVNKIVHALKNPVTDSVSEIENLDSDATAEDCGYDYSDLPIFSTAIGPVLNVSPEGIGVLVSHICSGNSDYVVFVNHSVTHEQKVTVELQYDGFQFHWVSGAENGQEVNVLEGVSMSGTTIDSFYIAPGGCKIMKFTDIYFKAI